MCWLARASVLNARTDNGAPELRTELRAWHVENVGSFATAPALSIPFCPRGFVRTKSVEPSARAR